MAKKKKKPAKKKLTPFQVQQKHLKAAKKAIDKCEGLGYVDRRALHEHLYATFFT